MVVAVEVVEGGVRQPGLVEVQRVEVAVEHLLDGLDVVADAVVGRLGDGQDARLLVLAANERVRLDLAPYVLDAELFQRDRTDDAVVVARGRQEHRHRAGHHDRVQDRLVAVAVDHHHVARGDRRVPDDLVRRRGAVGDEEQVVGVEDARGVALARRDRPGMV